jgi:endonuclease/exonuclease/phosphatase family metal-dependent hydrolase
MLTLDDKKKMAEIVGSGASNSQIANTTWQIMKKIGLAAKVRAHQIDKVLESIQNCDSTVILCGDFNDTPNSYTCHRIEKELTDVFSETCSGLGITYREWPFLFRIDHIMHTPGLKAGYFKVDKVNYSDHYPISCIVDLKEQNKN